MTDRKSRTQVVAETIEDLHRELKQFYEQHKDSGNRFDARVYNADGDDISDTYLVENLVREFLEEDEA